jgi:hypothetical protein
MYVIIYRVFKMYKYVTMGYHGIQVEMMSEDWKILHRCFLDDEAGKILDAGSG